MIETEKLLTLMRTHTYRPLSEEELIKALGIENTRGFLALLRKLEKEGLIILTRKNKYGLPEKMGLVVGRLQGHPKGFGFVIPDSPAGNGDVFVSAENLNGALHNDRVVVRVDPVKGPGDKRQGEIIRILHHANEKVVGTFEWGKKIGHVLPDDARLPQDILVPSGQYLGARTKDKIVVQITRWPERRRNPEGKVIEVLGRTGKPGVDILSVVRKYQLPEAFPEDVIQEAERFSEQFGAEDLSKRQDLRSLKMVTIDGADAKDLDDAVSLTKMENGKYQLGVHIADVSYYVREGSSLDKEAYARGTSVYLVDRVIPMLPERLSNKLCSLNPHVERLAMSVLMDIDRNGKLIKYEITPSVIRIDHRMTYDAVREILVDEDAGLKKKYDDFVQEFKWMEELCLALKGQRRLRGAIDFDFPESKVILDGEGKPVEIIELKRSIAESIIEEFMILANEVVARHMFQLEAPFVYRVHEKPIPEAIIELNRFLGQFGLGLESRGEQVEPGSLQKIVEAVAGRPEEAMINTVLLRSMKHARYDAQCFGHFGLASQYYCHFTSPIRRYPDLVIHRVIREFIENKGLTEKRLAKLHKIAVQAARQSSEREKVAEEAERESVDLKKVEYMERHLGDAFDGVVSGVLHFGMFVRLENSVEGLVHVSTLTDDYYRYDEKNFRLEGEHTRKAYRIGDRIRIQVIRVSVEARQIDFELI
ncbi:MAG: ribonuclease R [Bacillota bacterium]